MQKEKRRLSARKDNMSKKATVFESQKFKMVTDRQEAQSRGLVRTQPVTEGYYNSVVNAMPSYILSSATRYREFYNITKKEVDRYLISQAANRGVGFDWLYKEIDRIRAIETKESKRFLSALKYSSTVDPRKHMLSMLGSNLKWQLRNNNFNIARLQELMYFKIAEAYSAIGKSKSKASYRVRAYANSLFTDPQRAQELAALQAEVDTVISMLEKSGLENSINSPVVLRAIAILKNKIDNNQSLLETFLQTDDFNDLGGTAGWLAEVLQAATLLASFGKMATRFVAEDGERIKNKKIVMTSEVLGSVAAKGIVIDQIKQEIQNKQLNKGIKTDTDLSGLMTYGVTDARITLQIGSESFDFRLDVKNPETIGQTLYQTKTPTYSYEHLISDDIYRPNSNFQEIYKKIMFMVMSYVNIKQNFNKGDKTNLTNILIPIQTEVALRSETIAKFWAEGAFMGPNKDLSRPNFVVIGENYYFFSDILESIIKTYIKNANNIVRNAANLTVGGVDTLVSTANSNKKTLLDLKRSMASRKYFDIKFEERYKYFYSDSESGSQFQSLLREYESSLNSISFQVRLNLDLQKIKLSYNRSV